MRFHPTPEDVVLSAAERRVSQQVVETNRLGKRPCVPPFLERGASNTGAGAIALSDVASVLDITSLS